MLRMPPFLHRSAEVHQPRRPCRKIQEKVQYGIRTTSRNFDSGFFSAYQADRKIYFSVGLFFCIIWTLNPMTEFLFRGKIQIVRSHIQQNLRRMCMKETLNTKTDRRISPLHLRTAKSFENPSVCFPELYDIVGSTAQYIAQFFQCEQCDILVFLQ